MAVEIIADSSGKYLQKNILLICQNTYKIKVNSILKIKNIEFQWQEVSQNHNLNL